jgi:hypothetical protein
MTDFLSAEALTAALPQVLAAPRDGGAIRLLCLRPKPNHRSFSGRLTLTRAVGWCQKNANQSPFPPPRFGVRQREGRATRRERRRGTA